VGQVPRRWRICCYFRIEEETSAVTATAKSPRLCECDDETFFFVALLWPELFQNVADRIVVLRPTLSTAGSAFTTIEDRMYLTQGYLLHTHVLQRQT
jgi:hypothetical protein